MSKECKFDHVEQEMLLAIYNRPMPRIVEESPSQGMNKVQDGVASGRVPRWLGLKSSNPCF